VATLAAASQPVDIRPQGLTRIILSASLGTVIEWYDFFIFGSLTAIVAPKFFGTADANSSLLLWLAVYAVGFLVRPFGALFFGRIGDIVGRKYTFLVTLTIMGLSTAAIGLLPTVDQVSWIGIVLVLLRILEGLALGGEYGGAATYIAEYSPNGRRGFYTSFIQVTATAGLFISLLVILGLKLAMGATAFSDYGWRYVFLISAVLVAISIYIRLSLRESPMFTRLKEAGKTSKNPLAESFGNPVNRRMVLLVLFGATAGQGAVWYTSQFYAQTFMSATMKMGLVPDYLNTVYLIFVVALLLASPLFVVMGALSDRIGRKPLIMAGCLIGALLYYPAYRIMYSAGPFLDPAHVTAKTVAAAVLNPSYSPFLLGVIVFIMAIPVTMVYGPIAAYLVELFPTKIRYTSMSVPYHFGNGWFGGLVPVLATALSLSFGTYAGLIFPISVALMSLVIGTLLLKDTKNVDIAADTL